MPRPAGVGQALTAAGGLWALSRRRRNTRAEAVIADFSDELRSNWQDWAATAGHDPAAMESAARSFEDVLPHLAALPEEFVGVRLDPDALARRALEIAAEAMPTIYGDEDPRNTDSHLARTFLSTLICNAYRHLLARPGFSKRWRRNSGSRCSKRSRAFVRGLIELMTRSITSTGKSTHSCNGPMTPTSARISSGRLPA